MLFRSEKAGAAVEAAVGKDGKAPGKAIGGFIEGVLGNGGKAVPNAAPGTPAKRGQQEPAPGTQGPK